MLKERQQNGNNCITAEYTTQPEITNQQDVNTQELTTSDNNVEMEESEDGIYL